VDIVKALGIARTQNGSGRNIKKKNNSRRRRGKTSTVVILGPESSVKI